MRFASPNAAASRTNADLNVPSLIDIIFLLLIYFLFTSVLARPESRLSPDILTRDPNQATARQDFTPQVLHVEPRGTGVVYRLGERAVARQSELVPLLESLNRELGLYVEVADAVPVEHAAAALQAARDAGFERLTYVPAEAPASP